MDTKRISQIWVRNVYQKFEAVYQEVDEFMNKDPVKFVENHIQTVGDSVKKFCSGFMQDLILPPLVEASANSVTVTNESTIDNTISQPELGPTEKCPNMSPICEIIESPIKEVDTNPKLEHEGDDLMNNTSFQEEEIINDKISESDYDSVFEDADWGIDDIMDGNMESEKQIEEEPFVEENTEKVFMETSVSDESECDSNTLSRMKSLISCIENKEEKEKEKLYEPSIGEDSLIPSYYDISSCESSTCLDHDNNSYSTFGYSSFALSNESTYELDASMVKIEDLDMETIDLTDKEQLVEIVEGDKVFYFPYGSERSKSYKKMIRDAFTSRKKLTKEYEQLAQWCAVEQEFSQKIDKNDTKLQVQDFPEWELL